MKKRIIFVLTAAMLFFSQIMLSSCGDEEEDEPVQNNSGKNNSTNNNGTNNNGPNNNQQTVKEDSQYTVSYSSDFGVVPQSLTVNEGDKLTSGDLKPLDTDGYIFLGWYNGSNQVEEGYVVKQDLKLVAKWTKDGVVYANELKDFLAKKTDDSKVYDVTISDLNPDMDVVVKALKDNPKIKVNLNLENCTELKDVKIMPDGGISKSKTESFLINLVSLTLPNGVVNIVLGCDGLTSINIPNSVTTIEIYTETPPTIRNANAINPDCKIFIEKECVDVFKNAEGWETLSLKIRIRGVNYLYVNELMDFVSNQIDKSKIYDIVILDKNPNMETVSEVLTAGTIWDEINDVIKFNLDLRNCTDLKAMDWGNSEQYAFRIPELGEASWWSKSVCGLVSLKLPNNVTEVYLGGHTSFPEITDIEMPNNVEKLYIESGAKITNLYIPNSVKRLDLRYLEITTLDIPNSVEDLWLENNNELISINLPTNLRNLWYIGNNNIKPINIPNSVITLFMQGASPNNIPEQVQKLQLDCKLTSLIVPESVTNLRLWGCHDLTSILLYGSNPPSNDSDGIMIDVNSNCIINVPASAVETYKNADGWSQYANQIKPIDDDGTISLYVSELEGYLSNITDEYKTYNIKILDKSLNGFDNDGYSIDFMKYKYARINVNLDLSVCTQLKQIGPDFLSEQILPNNWGLLSLNVPDGVTHLVLQNYVGLTIFNIPKSVKTLGVGGCDGLTSLEIPNSVTDFQFESCAGITSLTIPNNVKRIYLDDSDNRLNSIYLSDIPPTIDNWSTINPNCTIYVPASTVETYKNANGWSKYANQILSDNSGDGEYHQTDGDAVIVDTSGSDDQQD